MKTKAKDMSSITKHSMQVLAWRAMMMVICLVATARISARSMGEIWISMPDSMALYIDKSAREECVKLFGMKMKAEVNNAFGEKVVVDTLAADYMSVRFSESASMQLRRLPAAEGDSVLCVVRTYNGPQPESSVRIYSQNWVEKTVMVFDIDRFIQRPDTMTVDKYEELTSLLDPYLISARMSEAGNTLEVSATVANVSADDARRMDAILVSRKMKWNGKTFE